MYEYNEAKHLERLLKAFDKQMADDIANDTLSYITIRVGNRHVKILAGAPQFEGICRMVEHIASENFYEVDFNNLTVKSCYPTVEEVCIKALQYSLEQAKTSEIDVLDGMSIEGNIYHLEKAIEVLRQKETEE